MKKKIILTIIFIITMVFITIGINYINEHYFVNESGRIKEGQDESKYVKIDNIEYKIDKYLSPLHDNVYIESINKDDKYIYVLKSEDGKYLKVQVNIFILLTNEFTPFAGHRRDKVSERKYIVVIPKNGAVESKSL
jgi:hypothetical protein